MDAGAESNPLHVLTAHVVGSDVKDIRPVKTSSCEWRTQDFEKGRPE